MEGLKCTAGTLQSLDVGSTEKGLNPRSVTDELEMFDVTSQTELIEFISQQRFWVHVKDFYKECCTQ